MYSVSVTGVSVTAAQDLFELTPADDKPIRVAGLWIAQTSDAGDAEEEILEILIKRGNTTSGSGGTTPAIETINPTDGAAGFTAEANNTTRASAGTADNLLHDGWNVRVPYQLLLPEDMRPSASQANTTLVIGLEDAPADAITLSATVMIEEVV